MLEAFPWDQAPQFLIRDRDGCYGDRYSPWQNGSVERLIDSIRRECLDHVIVLNEASWHRILRAYSCY